MIQKADKMQHRESQLERYSEIQTDHWQALRKKNKRKKQGERESTRVKDDRNKEHMVSEV